MRSVCRSEAQGKQVRTIGWIWGRMMCREVLSRRLSQVFSAATEGLYGADYDSVRHDSGVRGASDIVPSELRVFSRRMEREEHGSEALVRAGSPLKQILAKGAKGRRRGGKGALAAES